MRKKKKEDEKGKMHGEMSRWKRVRKKKKKRRRQRQKEGEAEWKENSDKEKYVKRN